MKLARKAWHRIKGRGDSATQASEMGEAGHQDAPALHESGSDSLVADGSGTDAKPEHSAQGQAEQPDSGRHATAGERPSGTRQSIVPPTGEPETASHASSVETVGSDTAPRSPRTSAEHPAADSPRDSLTPQATEGNGSPQTTSRSSSPHADRIKAKRRESAQSKDGLTPG